MAQIRRPPHYRSPPARQIPALPNPIRFHPATYTKNRSKALPFSNEQYDPVNGLMIEQSLAQENNNIEESIILPPVNNNDDEILQKKHLPVYAQFHFNNRLLTQPMEINIEDNIHKLRLRLIDSELNHQRRSTDEYIKRTHRIGTEDDLPNSMDMERDLDMRRFQESLNQRRRSNQQLMVSYDPRAQLYPLNEEQIYTTSNIDDLIDSMARRHLSYRRLDAAIDRQRQTDGYHRSSYNEVLGTGQASLQNNDIITTNRSSRNYTERDFLRANPNDFNRMLRSRIDYYNRIQPDLDGMGNDESNPNFRQKLPPISPGKDSNRGNNRQRNQSEHSIDLPSDIFLTSRSKPGNSAQRSRKTRQRSNSKGTDRSDGENEIPKTNRYKKNSQNGFFTESTSSQQKKTKLGQNSFKKTAIGVLFLTTLKHRSIKNRPKRSKQSPSATIHKIRLQEIIVALHRVYLEPDGPIYNALIQAISNPISLEHALNQSSKHHAEAIQIIGNALKNVISKIVDFMPKDGVLGTGKTSAVAALIQDGNPFPENYFWRCERELLEFNNSKIINITKQRAILLLIGVFIFRALVTTLLIKPIKYRLILGQLTPNQVISLKILASVILYIGRRVAGTKSQPLNLPDEWQLSLYPDKNIQSIIQHSEIKLIIDTCEESLGMWCEEYIRRIDQSFDRELRT